MGAHAERVGSPAGTAVRHPLDPLSAEEIAGAADILRRERSLAPSVRFVSVGLREPPKEAVLRGADVEREAFCVLFDNADGATYEAVVSLTAGAVVTWRQVPGVQPPFFVDEYADFVAALKADPRFRAALERRGITDLDLVSIDAIPPGYWGWGGRHGRPAPG